MIFCKFVFKKSVAIRKRATVYRAYVRRALKIIESHHFTRTFKRMGVSERESAASNHMSHHTLSIFSISDGITFTRTKSAFTTQKKKNKTFSTYKFHIPIRWRSMDDLQQCEGAIMHAEIEEGR